MGCAEPGSRTASLRSSEARETPLREFSSRRGEADPTRAVDLRDPAEPDMGLMEPTLVRHNRANGSDRVDPTNRIVIRHCLHVQSMCRTTSKQWGLSWLD